MGADDNLLDYMDETFFLDFRAQGHGPLIQLTWIYERDIDLLALEQFHHNLCKGLLGRRIERSPLPFGRPRWIQWTGRADIDVAKQARPRSEIKDWTYEQAALPIDPEGGPPWRLAVQPLLDGGAAVTLLVAHTVADGVGLAGSVSDAVRGVPRELSYPEPRARTKKQALLEDMRSFMRDLPAVVKAMIATPFAAKSLQRHVRPRFVPNGGLLRRDCTDASLVPHGLNNEPVALVRIPSVTARVDIQLWDQRAEALGGTSNSLFLGVVSRLCESVGWVDSDGFANFTIPVNERKPGDTRGNALTGVALTVDPSSVSADLKGVRAELKAALSTLEKVRGQVQAPLPLIPFVPLVASRRSQGILLKSANLTCSNLGDLDPAVNRPDGTDADRFDVRFMRYAGELTGAFLRDAGGLFFPVCSGRVNNSLFMTISYVDADGTTTNAHLTELVSRALDDFGLTGIID